MKTILLLILFFILLFMLIGDKTCTLEQKPQTYTPEEQRYIQLWEHNQKYQDDFGCLTNPPYWGIIKKYAKKHNLDANLVKAVIQVESRFNPKAKSYAGALGLMQLMPKYHYCKDYYDPEENIKVGTKLLSGLIKKYGLRQALLHYNSGYRRIENGYDRKVMANYER